MGRRKRRNRQRYYRNGFVLEQGLLALVIISLMMPIAFECFHLFVQSDKEVAAMQDGIALEQCRRTLLLADRIECFSDSLLIYQAEEVKELHLVNGNVLFQPGTLMVFTEVDEVLFYQQGSSIWMKLRRGNHEKEMCLVGA